MPVSDTRPQMHGSYACEYPLGSSAVHVPSVQEILPGAFVQLHVPYNQSHVSIL